MSDLDSLTLNAIAVPHDNTRRLVLADAVDEHSDHAVGKVLRDDSRGPAVLKATWRIAQERQVEPSYRLLWAVVTTGLDVEPSKQPARTAPPAATAPLPQARPLRRIGVRPAQPWVIGEPFGDWEVRPSPDIGNVRDVTDELRAAVQTLRDATRRSLGLPGQ